MWAQNRNMCGYRLVDIGKCGNRSELDVYNVTCIMCMSV